jgi:branched-chain amino acid transport system substrate-binding protein
MDTQNQQPSSFPAPGSTITSGSPSPPDQPSPAFTPGQSPRKPHRALLVSAIVILLLLALAAAGYLAYSNMNTAKTSAAETIPPLKVGVLMAFTGGSSSMGYGEMKGIQLAKKQLKADNIELVQMDSQCDKDVSPGAIKRLLDQKVVAVIGDGCSSASVAALIEADKAGVVMISPSASSPKLSIANDNFFRVVPPDTFQGSYLAKTMYDKGLRSAAVFYTNEPYGTALNGVFKEKFEALGGKVVAAVTAESDVITLDDQIKTIKAAKPDTVLFLPNSVVSGAAAIKLARTAGLTVPFYGGDGLYDRTLINNAGTAAEGMTITTFPTGTKDFKQLLLTEYQGEELYAAAQAYDAFQSLYLAIQQGARTPAEIKSKLPKVTFEGVSARIKFDANGEISDPDYKYALLRIKDGTFTSE